MDDLQILVKAIVDDACKKTMEADLKTIVQRMETANEINLKVGLDANSAKTVQTQLQAITKQITAAQKASNTSTLKVFDSTQLQADGQKYFINVKDIVARAQKEFSKLGTVDISNVFKTADGSIQSFSANVTKADGVVEKFNFNLAKIQTTSRQFSGFVQTSSVLTDKTAGTNLEQTLNYLNRIDTKIADITSKTLTNTSKPLLGDMSQFTEYQTKLTEVNTKIDSIKNANQTLSSEHKREIDSMVADLQRYAKELQTSAYAATDLNAATFTNKKAELQAALQTDIMAWQNSGIFGSTFEADVAKAKASLDSATDTNGLQAYKSQLIQLQNQFKQMKLENTASGQLINADTLNTNIQTAQLRLQNLKTTYSSFVSDPNLLSQWDNLFSQSQMVSSQKELTNLNAGIRNFEQTLISAGKHSTSFWSGSLANAEKMATWMFLGGAISGAIKGMTGLYDAVVDLDTAMVELKKVTNETDAAYDAFLTSAADKAIEIGASYSDFVTSSASFARLGYTLDEAEALAEVATIYSVVGDEIDSVDTATSSIISTMKAFGVETQDAMSIVDKFNEVGNNFAISSGGIGDAMQNSAAALAEANNTIDESIALVVSANNVIQDPDSVGTMWKTVSMRIRGATAELEEAGLETDYMAESTSDLQNIIKGLTNTDGLGGFDILEDPDTFKSTYDIILGISDVWEEMSDIDQAALLELLAGKRQGNALAASISNMDDAVKALETSVESEGSALEEHEKWMDSIQAKQNEFEAQYQKFATTFLSSDLIKGVYDAGSGVLGWLTTLTETLGAVPTLVAALTPFISKLQLLKTTTSKDWLGTGTGLTFSWNSNKVALENDIKLLDSYNTKIASLGTSQNDLTQRQIVWNDTIGKGSAQLKNSVNVTDGATVSTDAYRNSMTSASASSMALNVASKAAAVSITILKTAMNMLVTMGISIAISAIVSEISSFINKAKEAKEAASEYAVALKEQAQTAVESQSSLKSLIEEYKNLADASDGSWSSQEASKLLTIQDGITDLVGDQADNLDLVNGKIDEEYRKLLNIYGLLSQDTYDDTESYYRSTKEILESGYDREKDAWGNSADDDSLANWYIRKAYEQLNGIENAAAWWSEQADVNSDSWLGDIPAALEQIGSYEDGLERLYEWRRLLLDAEEAGFGYMGKDFWNGEEEWIAYDTADAIKYLNTTIEEFETVIEEADSAKQDFFSAKANKEVLDKLVSSDMNTQEAFSNYVRSVFNDDSLEKDYAEALIDTMHSYLPAFTIPDDVKRAMIADRDALLEELGNIPDSGSIDIVSWMDNLSDSDYEIFVQWWSQNKYSSVVTESEVSLLSAFNAHLARTQVEFDGVSSSSETLQGRLSDLWSSEDFEDAKEDLLEFSKTVDGITPENIIELAAESEDLAKILDEDGMNAAFLAKVLQNMAEGGDGVSLVTAEALKLNDALDGMVSKFDQVTVAKARYDSALSVAEKDDDFRSYAEAFEELNAQFEAGTTGSNAFWAAAEFLFGNEQLLEWGGLDGLDDIYTAMEKNRTIFEDADSAGAGLLARLYEMSEAGELLDDNGEKLLEIGKNSDGSWDFDIDVDNLELISDKLDIAEESLLATVKALQMWGEIDFYDISEVLQALKNGDFSVDIDDATVVNVERLTEQLLTLGKNDIEILDLFQELRNEGLNLLSLSDDVDTLTQSLGNLDLASSDGIDVTVNYEGLSDLLSNLGYTKDEAQALIEKLDDADNISLANADGEVKSVSDALDYIDTLTFTEVTASLSDVSGAVDDVDESSTSNVVSEVEAIGAAADIAVTKVYSIGDAIDEIDGKEATVYYDVAKKNSIIDSILSSIPGFASGTQNAPKTKALVGEEGTELVQSGNQAYLVGQNNPEIVSLNQGDRVFTADETQKILSSSGKHISGSIPAFADGGVVSSGLRVETNKTGITGTPYEIEVEVTTDEDITDELEEAIELLEDELDEIIGNFEHNIFLLEETDGSVDNIIAIYKAMQETVHDQAETYREMGLDEESDYIQDLQKLWWEYQGEIEDALHSIYETAVAEHENAFSLLENQYQSLSNQEMNLEMNSNLEEQIAAQKAIQSLASAEADRLRASGVDENDDLIQDLISTWWDAKEEIWSINSEIAANVIAEYDDFIDRADDFELWDNVSLTKASYLQQKISAINKLFEEGILTLQEYNELLWETNTELYSEQKDALDEIIEMTMDLIEQEAEDQVEALEDQIDAYQTIIDLKKESLESANEEDDYNDTVADKVEEIAEIQAKIAELSRDDSREAYAEKTELEEELAELQEELADYQADYAYDAQTDALDKEAEAFEDTKNEEIAITEAAVDTQEELYNAAIARIETDWDQLYEDLILWNSQYGDMIDGEDSITSAWQTAKAAAEEYGSVVSALDNIGSNLSESSGGDYSDEINGIVSQMYTNSQDYFSQDAAGKAALSQENLDLGASLAKYGITAVRGDDGTWYLDYIGGTKLFDEYPKYHSGGIVGEEPNLESNEQIAILENGEQVISNDALDNASSYPAFKHSMFEDYIKDNFDKDLAMIRKLGDLVMESGDRIENIVNDMSNIDNSENSTVGDINISNQFYTQGMSDAEMKKSAEYYADFTMGKMNSALRRKGLKNSFGSKAI